MITESSANQLYQSAVLAFPNTRRRQHVIGPVQITQLSYTPFVGMNTLFIRGAAVNEENTYKPMVLFKKVNYGKGISISDNNGMRYFLEQLSTEKNDVLVRCDCGDFFWRFVHYNYLDHSLYGRNRKKYEGQGLWKANPLEMPGMCKHLMKLMVELKNTKLLI